MRKHPKQFILNLLFRTVVSNSRICLKAITVRECDSRTISLSFCLGVALSHYADDLSIPKDFNHHLHRCLIVERLLCSFPCIKGRPLSWWKRPFHNQGRDRLYHSSSYPSFIPFAVLALHQGHKAGLPSDRNL